MSRGRPRSFDRDIALHAMMQVFWARGYEGAQLVDLTGAAGIAPPSFYAAFGSKEAAFLEAIELYIRTVGAGPMDALEMAPTLRQGLRAMLLASVDVALSQRPGGCLLILGVVNCLPENEAARNSLREARKTTRELIEVRLKRALAENELPQGTDVSQMTAFIHGAMQMISFQARDGSSRTELEALIEPVMRALD